ncbi:MAG TPA: hypothetical protein VGC97_18990 [Pyrinomonadaceae bacterium]|jgi:hypothetical protein
MKKSAAILLVFFCFALTAFAQREKPGSEMELAEITRRGKMLAEYDTAAWHSTDAVMALSPKEGSFNLYIGKKIGNAWTVAYGKLNEKKDKFLIAYETVQQAKPEDFKVETFNKRKEDAEYFLAAAKSLELTKAAFVRAEERPYNTAVLPASYGQFYIYFIPAQTENGIFPLGGDTRFLVSKDGSKIVETRQLHKAIIEFQVPTGIKPESGFHTAILDDIPEDTDVFHVLAREPKVPEMIVTQKFVYQIKIDGTIVYVMTTDAFKKIGKK